MRRPPPVTSADLPMRLGWDIRPPPPPSSALDHSSSFKNSVALWLAGRRGRVRRWRWWRRRRSCILGRSSIGGLTRRSSILVNLINRVLLARSLQAYFDAHVRFVDLVIFAIGLKAARNHLQAHGVADRQYVDDGFAVFVGLQLHVAFVLAVHHRMKDDGGVLNGLAIHVFEDGHLDPPGRRRRLVLAAAGRSRILTMGSH